MRFNLFYFLFFVIFIYSCSGGGSSQSDDITNNNNNQSNQFNERCINIGTNTQRCTFLHNNLERFYLIYSPQSLNQNINAPILFALHGYGSSASFHKSYTQYEALAEENKFILIYPQGYELNTVLTNSTSHWNVGAWTVGSTVDDVDFISTIIDIVSAKTSVDMSRIYSSGMSNGGFMSYELACQLSEKIAAIASVTGSMSKETLSNCNPKHPTSILQIHGLIDFTVPYNGNDAIGMESIEQVMQYWSEYNGCNPNSSITSSNYSNQKGSIDFISYQSCINNTHAKLIRIPSMNHTWPTLDNYNISASDEIWNFLSQFDINGKIN